MMDNPKVYVVQVTFPSLEDAQSVSSALLNRHWVACAQHCSNVQSMFFWKNQVEKELECVVTYKTTESFLPRLMTYVEAHHPYDTPECLYWPVTGGNTEYLDWVIASTEGLVGS